MATDVWHDDLLGRQHLAEIIVKYLVRRTQERLRLEKHGSYVLNLNSGWGHGKTFFLERLNKQLAQDGYLSVYVNGWRDDAGQEPLVAVIAAIEEGLKEHFRARVAIRKLWDKAKIAGGQALLSIAKGALHKASEKFIGEGMRDAIEIIDRADTDAASPSYSR